MVGLQSRRKHDFVDNIFVAYLYLLGFIYDEKEKRGSFDRSVLVCI